MSQETTFTFRVDEGLKSAFSEAAREQDRSGAQLLRDFMRLVVERQKADAAQDQWIREQVARGQASARAGRVRGHEQVEAEFAARRAASATRAGLKARKTRSDP